MRHLMLPEKLVEPRPPHSGCRGMREGVDKRSGVQLGGCPQCWSRTTWRWHCRACGFRTLWVEENVAANEEMARFAAHDPGADGAAAGRLPMWWEV